MGKLFTFFPYFLKYFASCKCNFSNPSPECENDALLNITWPVSGSDGTYLDFSDDLVVKHPSSTDFETEKLEEIVLENLKNGNCCYSKCELVSISPNGNENTCCWEPNFDNKEFSVCPSFT